MIDHLAFSTLAARSIDGWLTPDESLEFETHLRECGACRALLIDLRADDARLAGIGPMQTSPALRRQVLEATHRRTHPTWLLVAAALLLVAATVGVIAVGAYLTKQFVRPGIELSVDWQAIPAAELSGGASTSRIRAVVAGPDGLVAVGSAGGQAATWTSTDGVRWPRSPDLPGGAGAELVTVEVGGPGFIAAGRSGAGGAIWTSPDGVTWSPAGPPDAFPEAVVNLVRRSGDGWIAAGGAVGTAGLTGATWRSTDGLDWHASIASAIAKGFGTPLHNIRSLFQRPDGVWIAHSEPFGETPYSSPDRMNWELIAGGIPGLGGVKDVRQIGDMTIAVDGAVASWSRDGIGWTKSTMTPPVDGSIDAIDVGADGVFVLGTGPAGSFIYRSADGRAFARDASPIGGVGSTVYDVATFAGFEVAVGIDRGGGAVWSRKK